MHELLTRLLEQLRNAWRFRWYGVLMAWAVCVIGWLLVYSLPNVYQADARVRIDTTSVIRPLIKDLTVSPKPEWKVDLLIHTVLSKPNLIKIARNTGLSIQATTPAAKQALLSRLGSHIHIHNQRSQINLYKITYANRNARKARAVVQEVINVMTGMALGNGVQESQQAVNFLSGKVDDYHDRLRAIEKKLTAYKKKHPELIQGRGGYLARLQTTRVVLEQMKTREKTLANQQASLKQQLQKLGDSSIIVPASQSPQVRSVDQRIAQYQSELAKLLTRYTPQYPDVIRDKHIIARLRQQRRNLVARLHANPTYTSGKGTAAYRQIQQRIGDLEIELSTLRSSIEQKTLQTHVLESNSNSATDAQAQLNDLSRNYETIKKQYGLLLSRLNAARMSRDVSSMGDPLDFRIVDPPVIPDTPSGPPRMLFMLVVLLAGLGGGLVFAFFLSQIRPVFMNRRTLTEATGLPVLGSVSMAWSVRQRVQRRTSLLAFALVTAGLAVGFVAAVALIPAGIRIVPAILGYQWS